MTLKQKFKERLAENQEQGLAMPAPMVKIIIMLFEIALDVIEGEMDERETKK